MDWAALGKFLLGWVLAGIPSLIVGLSRYPKTSAGYKIYRFLNVFSILVHADSPSTFKAPVVMSSPPRDRAPLELPPQIPVPPPLPPVQP